MKPVFLSYCHRTKDTTHAARVRELGTRLREAGLSVVLDQFAQDEEFSGGGPDEGWPAWSITQAGNEDNRVLIIASPDSLKCYEHRNRERGTHLGAANEAAVVMQRLYNNGCINRDIRIVSFEPLDIQSIPLILQAYEHFTDPADFERLVRWLKGSGSRPSINRELAQARIESPPAEASSTSGISGGEVAPVSDAEALIRMTSAETQLSREKAPDANGAFIAEGTHTLEILAAGELNPSLPVHNNVLPVTDAQCAIGTQLRAETPGSLHQQKLVSPIPEPPELLHSTTVGAHENGTPVPIAKDQESPLSAHPRKTLHLVYSAGAVAVAACLGFLGLYRSTDKSRLHAVTSTSSSGAESRVAADSATGGVSSSPELGLAIVAGGGAAYGGTSNKNQTILRRRSGELHSTAGGTQAINTSLPPSASAAPAESANANQSLVDTSSPTADLSRSGSLPRDLLAPAAARQVPKDLLAPAPAPSRRVNKELFAPEANPNH